MGLLIACLRADYDDSFTGLAEAAGKDIDWPVFIGLCAEHRVYPTVHGVLRRNSGLVPESVLSDLGVMARRNTMRSMALCGELVRLAGVLRREGIRVLALKGPAMAQQVYGNASRRVSCDLDFLVEARQWRHAGAILAAEGYARLDMGLTPKQDAAFHSHLCICGFHRRNPDVEIDLHWALSTSHYGRITFEELWNESEEIQIDGYPVRTLARVTLLPYLAMHGVKHYWLEFRHLLDVVKIRSCLAGAEWERVASRIDRWNLQRVIGQTMLVSSTLLSCTWPRDFAPWARGGLVRNLAGTAFTISGLTQAAAGNGAADARRAWRLSLNKFKHEWLISGSWSDRLFLLRLYLQPCEDDFRALPLPDWLFFLYYPLRPLIFVLRKSGVLRVKAR